MEHEHTELYIATFYELYSTGNAIIGRHLIVFYHKLNGMFLNYKTSLKSQTCCYRRVIKKNT